MTAEHVIQTILGSTAIIATVTAILGFLSRSIVNNWLARNIEQFKSQLQAEAQRDLERYKSDLQAQAQRDLAQLKSSLELAAFEHQTRVSRLHEKRAEIIGELYGKTADLQTCASEYIKKFSAEDANHNEQAMKKVMEASDAFTEYFERHRVYFRQDLCHTIEQLQRTLSKACDHIKWNVQDGLNKDVVYPEQLLFDWNRSFETLTKDLPVVKNALEESFRELLGVLEPGSYRQPQANTKGRATRYRLTNDLAITWWRGLHVSATPLKARCRGLYRCSV